jgi:hypothetical protein
MRAGDSFDCQAHRNLLVANNEILGFPKRVILLWNVQDSTVSNNRVVPVSACEGGLDTSEPITRHNNTAVRLENRNLRTREHHRE